MDTLINIPPTVLLAIGASVVAVVVWLVKRNVGNALDEQFDRIKRENMEGRKEREYDNYLLLKGMQVVTDMEHELVHCVMTGSHNGGLEKANQELEEFRRMSNENLVKKAARWNLKIDR